MKFLIIFVSLLGLSACGDKPEPKRSSLYYYEDAGTEIIVSRITYLGEDRIEFSQASVNPTDDSLNSHLLECGNAEYNYEDKTHYFDMDDGYKMRDSTRKPLMINAEVPLRSGVKKDHAWMSPDKKEVDRLLPKTSCL